MVNDTQRLILIADDSPSIRRLLEAAISNAGYRVLAASDGREALKIAFENPVDAVIADQEMPELLGSELFRILRTDPEKKAVPRILISGHTNENGEIFTETADHFIAKSSELKKELIELLARIL